ncbi:MAG: hypothetical protein KGM96_13075 [Acidobacteriota bacterium]|nr:hypothetical protein [Acidobacteriota bacterium]
MKTLLLALFAALFVLPAHGEADPVLRVDYSNPGLTPSQWTLTLHPDGSGHFHADRGNAPAEKPLAMEPATVDRDVHLNEQFARHLFDTVRRQHFWDGKCESHLKVAFQGWKKISYNGPDGQGSCEFNYSKNREIQQLGETFVAVASTILEGARLELLLQHDPLGLDKEMEFLVESAGDGRLQQICAIRGILERLEADPGVLDRVRKRARKLLAQAEK